MLCYEKLVSRGIPTTRRIEPNTHSRHETVPAPSIWTHYRQLSIHSGRKWRLIRKRLNVRELDDCRVGEILGWYFPDSVRERTTI